MKNLKQIQQLKRLHKMIKLEATGNPREMAQRMHISERQLYNLLDQLRDMEAPICFNRRANTYLYTGEFDLLVNISVQVIRGDQLTNIYAGRKIFRTFCRTARIVQSENLYSPGHDILDVVHTTLPDH